MPPPSPIPLWPVRIGCENHIPYYIIATFSEQIHNRWFVGDYHKNIQNNILTLERGDEHE